MCYCFNVLLQPIAYIFTIVTNSKANGSNDNGKVEGYTKYDAIRLIENDDGLFIKLNDPTFSRSSLESNNLLDHGDVEFLPFTSVSDCRQQMTTSTANLERTPIKFSPSVLPYNVAGWLPSGGAVLSSNNQAMTITNRGYCGETYLVYGITNRSAEEHSLSVTF